MKAIIFDCDGTLIDSELAHCQAWMKVAEKYGYTLTETDYHSFAGKPAKLIAAEIAKKIGRPCADELARDKKALYHTLLSAGLPPIAPTVAFVHELAREKEKRKLKLGLASAARKEDILLSLSHLGISMHFDVIISGQDDLTDYTDPEGTNKPKPYIYRHTAKILGLSPQECIAIEDSHSGVLAGVSAGCFTIAVPNAFTKTHDLSQAHLQLSSFAGLTINDFFQLIK